MNKTTQPGHRSVRQQNWGMGFCSHALSVSPVRSINCDWVSALDYRAQRSPWVGEALVITDETRSLSALSVSVNVYITGPVVGT